VLSYDLTFVRHEICSIGRWALWVISWTTCCFISYFLCGREESELRWRTERWLPGQAFSQSKQKLWRIKEIDHWFLSAVNWHVRFMERVYYYILLDEFRYLGVIILTLARPLADNLRPCVASVKGSELQDIHTVNSLSRERPVRHTEDGTLLLNDK
jgi:hypothetical protein